ncbi:MAG: 50S ribosomal protein L23 [Bacteroidota bacterium]
MSVLKKPLVSEKMTVLNERPSTKYNQYAFKVDMKATKPQIKREVEEMYDVTVRGVRTMIVQGKMRNRYTRAGYITGKSPNYKKAVVSLVEGDEIDFYKNI